MNRTDGFLSTLLGSWGVVFCEVILTKVELISEVLGEAAVQGEAFSWLRTCSLPSQPVIVGKFELRCTPLARLTVDHYCLSVMLPLATRCPSWAVWSACALWRSVEQARVAWRAFTRCWRDRDIYFHASCLAETASLHSGVHHEGPDGRVTSIRHGMNCFIPDKILLETC